VIFSKLKTGLWPTRDVIFDRMQLVANGQTSNGTDEEMLFLILIEKMKLSGHIKRRSNQIINQGGHYRLIRQSVEDLLQNIKSMELIIQVIMNMKQLKRAQSRIWIREI